MQKPSPAGVSQVYEGLCQGCLGRLPVCLHQPFVSVAPPPGVLFPGTLGSEPEGLNGAPGVSGSQDLKGHNLGRVTHCYESTCVSTPV